jgi:hypothetical protein
MDSEDEEEIIDIEEYEVKNNSLTIKGPVKTE